MVTLGDAIALPAELQQRVRELAAETGTSPGQIMIDAIEEYLADLEDGRVAASRLDALRAGHADTVSIEELMARYGMAD